MICPLYNALRQELFEKIKTIYPIFQEYDNEHKFIWLMSTLDLDILKDIATYINACFATRK